MKSKCIMIQGTSSSVGKSLITAGLCRIFMQDGFKVAPFKSQNMALNSFITKERKEMGRAQVVQAEAAGAEPSVEMNPVLIKPNSDMHAQIIINGEVHGNMSAVEYDSFKPQLKSMIKSIYEDLKNKNDIVVIEGAGSPAEINLKENDIVNMGMAEIADAPVILVGDIDKGGVFASLAGTMLLLTEEEKKRIKGVIINKFRGDIEILKPGLKMLEDIIKIPVLGVLPYHEHKIDDEDGHLDERLTFKKTEDGSCLDIAVIKLKHMSNYTDFNILDSFVGISVRYVDKSRELGKPDLIIIPGSKNTIGDLLGIRKDGLEAEIISLSKKGTVVFGICGGYQMLGNEISDPFYTESETADTVGMGLLNIRTVFQKKKITSQTAAHITDDSGVLAGLKGVPVKGYEIHMGKTEFGTGCIPFILTSDSDSSVSERTNGVRNEEGTVFGTYIHGIFDNTEFTKGFINNLRAKKGLNGICQEFISLNEIKEVEYNKLADMIRENLDIKEIYRILNI